MSCPVLSCHSNKWPTLAAKHTFQPCEEIIIRGNIDLDYHLFIRNKLWERKVPSSIRFTTKKSVTTRPYVSRPVFSSSTPANGICEFPTSTGSFLFVCTEEKRAHTWFYSFWGDGDDDFVRLCGVFFFLDSTRRRYRYNLYVSTNSLLSTSSSSSSSSRSRRRSSPLSSSSLANT